METLVAAAHAKLVAYPILYAGAAALAAVLVWIVLAVDAGNRAQGQLQATQEDESRRLTRVADWLSEVEQKVEDLREDLDEFQTEYDAKVPRLEELADGLEFRDAVYCGAICKLITEQAKTARELAAVKAAVEELPAEVHAVYVTSYEFVYTVVFPFERV